MTEQRSMPIYTFDEAMNFLKQGKKVAREGSNDVYIDITDLETNSKQVDILSEDWLVID